MRAQRGQLSSGQGLVSGGKQKAPTDGGAACGKQEVCSDSSTALLWGGWSSGQLCLCDKAFELMTIGSPVGFLSNKRLL